MELVYPIYLDTTMMMGLLASLDEGLVEEATLEKVQGDSVQKKKGLSVGVKVSKLLSAFIDAEAKGDMSSQASHSVQSQYTSTIKYPSISLFIKLRELLKEKEYIKEMKSSSDVDSVELGDLIELGGIATPNPSLQISKVVNQLIPLIDPFLKMKENDLQAKALELRHIKPFTYTEEDGSVVQIDKRRIQDMQELKKIEISSVQIEREKYQIMSEMYKGLFPDEESDSILVSNDFVKSINIVYRQFARLNRIHDIFNGSWKCLGKVIGILKRDEEYDLLSGVPVGYMAKGEFDKLSTAFNNEQLRIDIPNSVLKGPAFKIATIAIFA